MARKGLLSIITWLVGPLKCLLAQRLRVVFTELPDVFSVRNGLGNLCQSGLPRYFWW